MYNGLLIAHSYLRYIILILLIIVIITSLLGLVNKKAYTDGDNKLGLFLFISTHLQLLLGLILFFRKPRRAVLGRCHEKSGNALLACGT